MHCQTKRGAQTFCEKFNLFSNIAQYVWSLYQTLDMNEKFEFDLAGILPDSVSDSDAVQGGLDLTLNLLPPPHLQSCPAKVSPICLDSESSDGSSPGCLKCCLKIGYAPVSTQV